MKLSRFDKRKIAERDMISTKQIEKQIKDQIKEKLVQATKQREGNKERRDLNKVKSGQYQVITNSTKIRKYDKKARSKVMKMSSEMIESLAQRTSTKKVSNTF